MTKGSTKAAEGRGMSGSQLARLFRRDRQTVSGWVAAGVPTCGCSTRAGGATVDWLLDPAEVVRWLLERERAEERERVETKLEAELDRLRRALEAAVGGNGEPATRAEALRRRTLAEARLRELELAEREGELVDVGEHNAIWQTAFLGARARLFAMPDKLALDLASASKPQECFALVQRELYEALNGVADGAEAMMAAAPDGEYLRLVVGDTHEVIAGPIGWLKAAAEHAGALPDALLESTEGVANG